MPLLLFDLDNTLIDRDRAFRAWTADFIAERRLPESELDWLATLDGGGYVTRQVFFRAALTRYGVTGRAREEQMAELTAQYREAMVERVCFPGENREALLAARRAGWTLGVVTNGDTAHQSAKIAAAGIDELVEAYVVSEEAGHEKPDPEIFRIAALRCGLDDEELSERLADGTAWMVGDHAPADIAGARVAGLDSVWLRHRRPWPQVTFHPTLMADALPEAVRLVLERQPQPQSRRPLRPGTPAQPSERDHQRERPTGTNPSPRYSGSPGAVAVNVATRPAS
ncbi:HAD family hydrolase [Phaeacidiphilus oryzae]|uniref:HAD family hydrolase n=1 Tax=Phaeacidiphilus oryzae TaxID=348818 RepID=UPI000A462C35|nr:HAD family hydrolase [Phaeacidiphilus oryzae]